MDRENIRFKTLTAILFANKQELTPKGEVFAWHQLYVKEKSPLVTALEINNFQNNMNSDSPLLFVEVTQ